MVVLDHIDDVVLGVMMHPHWRGKFQTLGCDAWIVGDDLYGIVRILLIQVRLVLSEIDETVKIAIDDIGVGLCGVDLGGVGLGGESNLHAVRIVPYAPVPPLKFHRETGC